MDPIDLGVARFRAQGDQLRSAVREALIEMPLPDRVGLFRACARGEFPGLDANLTSLVAWLAAVAMLDLSEPPGTEERS